MNKKILILPIFFLLILISLVNNSFAAPYYGYPKEYDITILNLHKKDIEKIELFTPWGYSNGDDNERVEIDSRQFPYYNFYYTSDNLKYGGVKCKILDTITKDRIKSSKNSISFNITPNENLTSFYFRIYMKDNSVVYSNYINSYTIIDEYSTKEKVIEAGKIKDKIVYWTGNFETRDPWIVLHECDIGITDNNNTNTSTNYFIIPLVIIVILSTILSIIFFKKYKKNKIFKILILALLFCIVICSIVYIIYYFNNVNPNENEEKLKTYVQEQDKLYEKEKQEYIDRIKKEKEEKEKEEKESEVIKVNLVDMSIDKRYFWTNNTAYMMTKQVRIEDSSNKSNELYRIVYFSPEFFENFFYGSFYDEDNQIFYFTQDKRSYVKANNYSCYEDDSTFTLVQNANLKTIIKDGKLFIPLPLYRYESILKGCFGFDEETNTIYYYGDPMGLPENYTFSDIDDSIKLKEKLSHRDYYYNPNKLSNDAGYCTLDYMIDYKNGLYMYYSAEINGKPCNIKLYYRYNINTHDYHYDKYEIVD